MQETSRAQMEAELGATIDRNFLDADFVQRFHRTLRLAEGRTKRGEVVLADQMRGRLPHGIAVKAGVHGPDPAPLQHRRGAT